MEFNKTSRQDSFPSSTRLRRSLHCRIPLPGVKSERSREGFTVRSAGKPALLDETMQRSGFGHGGRNTRDAKALGGRLSKLRTLAGNVEFFCISQVKLCRGELKRAPPHPALSHDGERVFLRCLSTNAQLQNGRRGTVNSAHGRRESNEQSEHESALADCCCGLPDIEDARGRRGIELPEHLPAAFDAARDRAAAQGEMVPAQDGVKNQAGSPTDARVSDNSNNTAGRRLWGWPSSCSAEFSAKARTCGPP
jgi:hypothetical protein